MYALAVIAFVLGSISISSCNNGGGEESTDPCDSTTGYKLISGDLVVVEITNSRDLNGKYEIKKLPDTTTRIVDARAALAVTCE